MTTEILLKRIDSILTLAAVARTKIWDSIGVKHVHTEPFYEFKAAALSLLGNTLGENHSSFKEFKSAMDNTRLLSLNAGVGVFKAFRHDVEDGWLFTFKKIVSAEIFTDFLEMASHLLQEGYKDAAAVMIGGVLEEHLRQLCVKNGLDVTTLKEGKDIPKTADRMNNDLSGAGVYGKLYQKSVTTWLDLRNKAAHGKYTEYDERQVQLMEASVLDFVAKTNGTSL
ncbi:hypothetical protein [Hymenobacter bucti]|uniref:DUF4145 domain-containing protein n=1 Tax=Hymenobacter bucti TaxID=1844114 RepID=A0ABW4QYA1_9BACT